MHRRCRSRVLDLRRRGNVRNRTQIARAHLERDLYWRVVSIHRYGGLTPGPIQNGVRRRDAGALVLAALANLDQGGERRRRMLPRQLANFPMALRPPTGIAA